MFGVCGGVCSCGEGVHLETRAGYPVLSIRPLFSDGGGGVGRVFSEPGAKNKKLQ